jgi:serpin B
MRPRSQRSAATRSTSLLLAVMITLGFITLGVAACGVGNDTTRPSAPDETSTTNVTAPASSLQNAILAKSDVPRSPATASDSDIRSAAQSVQAFGIDLYTVLADRADASNVVFSPASIVTALAMTYVGAAGNTAPEMAKTLHFTLPDETLHPAFNALDTLLKSRSWEGKDHKGDKVGVLVRSANSLWGQRDVVFEKPFLDTIAADYGAGVRLVDFTTAAEEARKAINSWVSTETADKIPELIPQNTLDALTRMVLVNAVYLDATWASQFDLEQTEDGPFTTLSGDVVTVPMMRQSTPYAYGIGDGWQAVQLPYLHDELAMLLIVPDQGRFAEIEARLVPAGTADGLIDQAVQSLSTTVEVQLTMPKFKFRTQAGLREALQSLGMTSAFAADQADFSRMTTQEPLFISDVIHEAYIAVDEEGTEAAAATAVVMRALGVMETMETITLTIDRPFLFTLRDVETGALLFLGRVTDPAA